MATTDNVTPPPEDTQDDSPKSPLYTLPDGLMWRAGLSWPAAVATGSAAFVALVFTAVALDKYFQQAATTTTTTTNAAAMPAPKELITRTVVESTDQNFAVVLLVVGLGLIGVGICLALGEVVRIVVKDAEKARLSLGVDKETLKAVGDLFSTVATAARGLTPGRLIIIMGFVVVLSSAYVARPVAPLDGAATAPAAASSSAPSPAPTSSQAASGQASPEPADSPSTGSGDGPTTAPSAS